MTPASRRLVLVGLAAALIAVVGWSYYRSLVPAIHPDHDHGLQNLAGGGFLWVEAVQGKRRNLVGAPKRVLIIHWFEPKAPTTVAELPALIDYARSVENDPDIEFVLVAMNDTRESVREWAERHGIPTRHLHADPQGKTAQLIGVRRVPETLIYDPQGHLVHQARGPLDWSAPNVREAIARFKAGGGEHQH